MTALEERLLGLFEKCFGSGQFEDFAVSGSFQEYLLKCSAKGADPALAKDDWLFVHNTEYNDVSGEMASALLEKMKEYGVLNSPPFFSGEMLS